jgi:hypothetical protein
VSNERYPTSSYIGNIVFSCTIYSRRPKSHLAMKVFIIFLQDVSFILKKTIPISLHRLTGASMGSFSAAFIVPSRNKEYLDTFLHYAEVVTCNHKRSKSCCSTGRVFSVHTSLVWGLVDDPSQ